MRGDGRDGRGGDGSALLSSNLCVAEMFLAAKKMLSSSKAEKLLEIIAVDAAERGVDATAGAASEKKFADAIATKSSK